MSNAKVRVPMDMPGTFRVCNYGDEANDRNTKAVVSHQMRPLIDALSRKRPTWSFLSTGYAGWNSNTNAYENTSFTIEDGGEVLGSIDCGPNYRTGAAIYELDNRRLRAARTRNGVTKTEKLDKAVQLILKNYFNKSIGERMADAVILRSKVIRDTYSSASFAFDRKLSDKRFMVMDYLNETMGAMPVKYQEAFKELPELYDKRNILQPMAAAMDNRRGATVLEANGYLYVHTEGATQPTSFPLTEAPPPIAMAVGMLKLVNNNQAIPDIGMRIEDNVFFVLRPEG